MRGLRAFGALVFVFFGARAHAQVCSERAPCVNVITLPPSAASIGSHRMVAAGGALVWPGFVDVHALDLATGRARSLAHCGTVVGDVAVLGAWVYVLADHAQLCRVPLATGRGVQMLVAAEGAVVDAFAVSSAAVAWSYRRRGDQPELRVMPWSGQLRSFPTAVTVEHVAVDGTTVYWVEAGTHSARRS